MTFSFFESQMSRLNGLRFVPADFLTHWEALQDMPAEALEAAVTHAQRTRVEFPTPIELRRDADAVRPRGVSDDEDRYIELDAPVAFTVPALVDGTVLKPIVVDREWKFHCEDCKDTGRVSVWCGSRPAFRQPWLTVRKCASRKCERLSKGHAEYGHEWVYECPCVDWNPDIKKRKEREAQYAASAEKGRR